MHLPERLRTKRPPTFTTVAVAATLVACAAAIACGPEFTQLLSSRQATLGAPVSYNFEREARRLVTPKSKLPQPPKAVEPADAAPADGAKAFARIEAAGLSSAQAAQVVEMRSKGSGDEAWAWSKGKDLPEAVRLYTAAAVDFHRGEPQDCDGNTDCDQQQVDQPEALRRAAARFEAVLALPEARRRARATWAAFSLGRTQRLMKAPDAAAAAFRRTRDEAAKGASDPLALALASLGEEARVELERGHVAQAVALYAEQAAQGSESGELSLHEVADRIYADPALLKASIGDPLVRRLMVVYALSYGESDDAASESPAVASAASAPEPAAPSAPAPAAAVAASAAASSAVPSAAPTAAAAASAASPSTAASATVTSSAVAPAAAASAAAPPSAPTLAAKVPPNRRMARLLDAILQADAGQLQDADRLAALAYAAGRYDLAAKLAPRSQSAVASWVSAKLALRAGNKELAAQHSRRPSARWRRSPTTGCPTARASACAPSRAWSR